MQTAECPFTLEDLPPCPYATWELARCLRRPPSCSSCRGCTLKAPYPARSWPEGLSAPSQVSKPIFE
eukprot:11154166-Prorocentrum_lima.AAC.1